MTFKSAVCGRPDTALDFAPVAGGKFMASGFIDGGTSRRTYRGENDYSQTVLPHFSISPTELILNLVVRRIFNVDSLSRAERNILRNYLDISIRCVFALEFRIRLYDLVIVHHLGYQKEGETI